MSPPEVDRAILARMDEIIANGRALPPDILNQLRPSRSNLAKWKETCLAFLPRLPQVAAVRDFTARLTSIIENDATTDPVASFQGLRDAYAAGDVRPAPLPPDPILARFDELVAQGDALKVERHVSQRTSRFGRGDEVIEKVHEEIPADPFLQWKTACVTLLAQLLPDDSPHRSLVVNFQNYSNVPQNRESLLARLKALRSDYQKGHLVTRPLLAAPQVESITRVRRLCERFHAVARQLTRRREDRPTLDVTDEYDVQDLMHALLKIDFDDVRAEDHQSWRAGSTSRNDFVLAGRGIVLELKHTRGKLTDKELGAQLAHDIELYFDHPECQTLVFFIYDPARALRNSVGLEKMSSKRTRNGKEITVEVLIYPKDHA